MKKYIDIPFDKIEIDQKLLDIIEKERSNIFTWNGQFSPQFVEVIIKKYCCENNVIYDPFLGSGTVLYEAGLNNFEAYGTEVNPSAFYLSRNYQIINIDKSIRINFLQEVENLLKKYVEEIYFNIDYFKKTVKNILEKLDDLKKSILESFVALLDIENKKLDFDILFKKWSIYKNKIIELPYSSKPIKAFNTDARRSPLKNNSIDFVITSPPYINVFNYHQQYRKSMEFLGYEVLKYAKSEIGSNRKNRSNRFLTVIQYCLDISLVLLELVRVCKKNAKIIFIVGRESNIKKTSFNNSEIVYMLGVKCLGLKLDLKQERVFKNRYGQMIYEDILHFKNTKQPIKNDDLIKEAKNIARKILKQSLEYASENVKDEILEAISKINMIEPSPIL